MLRKTLVVSVATSTLLFSSFASAELSGNFGATSDYLWRGVTQTNHQAAISGGLDYAHSTGLYAGTWASNVAWDATTSDTEVDVYAGFSGEAAGLSYDLGFIKYHYPNAYEDFDEVYVGLGYSLVSLSYALDSENENSYVSVGVDYEVKEGLALNITAGSYSFEDSEGDYTHFGGSLTKSIDGGWDFTFGVSDTDVEDDNPIAVVSIAKEFDL